MRNLCKLCLILTVVTLTACSNLALKPAKPTIELVSVVPLNISVSEQKLRFTLRVTNPNSFEMPIDSVDFIARFNNTNIASGKSIQSVIIGPNDDATVSLDVTAGLDRLASTLQTLLTGDTLNLDYELQGTVSVATWPTPIPFDVLGAMDLSDL